MVLLLEEGEGKAETAEEKRGVADVEVGGGEDCGWLVGCKKKSEQKGVILGRGGRGIVVGSSILERNIRFVLTDELCTEADVTAATDTTADDAFSLTRLLVKTALEVGVDVGVGVEDAWLVTSLLVLLLVFSTDEVVVVAG